MFDSETELMSRAQAGDREAVSRLLERSGPAVRRELDGLIPKKWQSLLSMDDVLQQSYTNAFIHIRSFEPRGEGSFTGWLIALARNTLFDALRMLDADKRGGNHRRVEASQGTQSYVALFEFLGADSSTPSRDAVRHEGEAALMAAIDALPADYKRLIQMYDLEGRSAEEVAAALHRSVGAMYMVRARAHRRLAELLGTASQYLSRSS